MYRRGDITENMSNLDEAVSEAEERLTNTEQWDSGKTNEVEQIVAATCDAAASAGAAAFTEEFDGEASELLALVKPIHLSTVLINDWGIGHLRVDSERRKHSGSKYIHVTPRLK